VADPHILKLRFKLYRHIASHLNIAKYQLVDTRHQEFIVSIACDENCMGITVKCEMHDFV